MYHFIVNPHSRTGKGQKIWKETEAILKEENVPYRAWFTKGIGHATEIAARITEDGTQRTIVILGGDGTLNEVIEGIAWPDRVTLGYLPTGSSNDFARSLKLKKDLRKALSSILHPKKFQYVDIGVAGSKDKKRRFCVSSGIGFDAAVCHDALTSRLKNVLNLLHLGKLTYTGIALRHILLRHTEKLTVTLDRGKPLVFRHVLFAAAMNQPYEGGGFKFCPKARCSDGILDVIVVEKMSRLKMLLVLPTAYFGRHTKFKGIHIYTCREAVFSSPANMPLHTDGESFGCEDELHVGISPRKLRMITG